MSSWPLAQQFALMLQYPSLAFRDPLLQGCQIRQDRFGLPVAKSGRFAAVFEATAAQGRRYAVRVFTAPDRDRQARLTYLQQHLARRRPRFLVGLYYQHEGIRSTDGHWYPLVVMDWVEGQTLHRWLEAHCQVDDTKAIASLADRWVDVMSELARHKVAHGDLHHDNIFVDAKGEIRLVDYDCMCVPKLVGRPNPETGMRPYQHPQRTVDTPLSLQMDAFSGLVILVALRALAARPQLWQEHVRQSGYEKLLLREEDFQTPGETPLSRELLRSPDPTVRGLSQQLFQLYRTPLEHVGWFRQLLSRQGCSWDDIAALIDQRDWDNVVARLQERRPLGHPPDTLRPWIGVANRWVRWRSTFQAAVRSGEVAVMEHLLSEVSVADYPAAEPLIQQARFLVDRAKKVSVIAGRLKQIPKDLPLHAYDEQLLSVWKPEEDGFCATVELGPWRLAHQKAIARRRLLDELEKSAERQDFAAVLRYARDPLLLGYVLPTTLQTAIRTAAAWGTSAPKDER